MKRHPLERASLRRRQVGWVQFVWYIVTLVLSIALAPKPPRPKPAALEDFDIPVAEEDRPIPVLFGTQRVTGANIIDYGALSIRPIRKSSLFSSATVGFRYYLGMHLVICHGPVDALIRLEAADKEAWSGNVTASSQISIDADDLFGGDKREGGIQGLLDVEMGEATQGVNAYLSGTLHPGQAVPAYRGVFGLVWKTGETAGGGGGIFASLNTVRHGYVGNTPYVKPWAITARRILKGWINDAPWYPEAAVIGAGMNPAHIIYQCLTDSRWGQGSPVAMIDDDNFRAVADQLVIEGFGLSMLWNQQSLIDEFVQIVCDHIGAILGFDHSTGKYVIRLIRADYNAPDLELFDETQITVMTHFERRSWGETVNELALGYTDPDTYKAKTIVVQDLGNLRAQGERVVEKLTYSGIASHTLAATAAARELAARSTPLARGEFEINRKFWRYGPGEVFRLSWARENVEQVVFRVLEVRGGTLERGTIKVNAIEDIFALGLIEYTEPQPSPGEPQIPETPDTDTNVGFTVISATQNSPPLTGMLDGDAYLIPLTPAATGAWALHEGEIAIWDEITDSWTFSEPPAGALIWVEDQQTYIAIDENGNPAPAPWTPAIPPLTEDVAPVLGDLMLVAYNTDTEEYIKVAADNVGGGGGATPATIVGGLGPLSPDTPPFPAQPADDEFEFGTVPDENGDRRADSLAWSWRNEDATVSAVGGGNLILICPADAGRELHGLEQTISGNFVYRAKVLVKHSSGNTMLGGVYVGRNGTGALLSLSWGWVGGAQTLQADRWTTATSHSSAQGASTAIDEDHDKFGWLYLEVEYDGTDVVFRYSKSGVESTFIEFYSEAAATHLGAAPDRVGVWGASSNAGESTVVVVDWFRRVPAAGFVYPPSVVDLQTRTLQELILDQNPDVYYICKDGAGSLTDFSGNGYHLTTQVGSPDNSASPLVPGDPSGMYLRLPDGNHSYGRANPFTVPISGDWTLISIVCPLDYGTNIVHPFTLGGDGEGETQNVQIDLRINASGIAIFWEHGAGIDDTIASGIPLAEGETALIAVVKDGAANTLTFYKNGVRVAAVSYSNEPTGGSASPKIGVGDVTTVPNTGECIVGQVALFLDQKLAASTIATIGRAAGLFGPPIVLQPAPQAVGGNGAADIQVFTGSGTWTKPTGASHVTVICFGAGGGGGGGRKGAVGSTRPGGAGGSGGGRSFGQFVAADLGATEPVTCGSGGTPGAGATADSTNGGPGGAGAASSFGDVLKADPGLGGGGGAGTSVAGPAGGIGNLEDGGGGGTGGTTTTGSAGDDAKFAGPGGGGGHGVSSANNVGSGLNDGGDVTTTNPALQGGAAGAAAGAAGADGAETGIGGTPGSGGGGGAGHGTANSNGGDGGDGKAGGGGGGGGGATNGTGKGGDGGTGGGGIVIVVTV